MVASLRRSRNAGPTLNESFSEIRSDYNAARASRHRRRRTGIQAAGSSADYHYRSEGDYLRILEYARDFDRNDAVVGQLVDRAVDNTVQGGIQLDPQTPDKAVNTELYERWTEWAENEDLSDFAGEQCWAGQESLALRNALVDGDVVGVPLKDGSLQWIEAHRIRTPNGTKRNVVNGVLLDERRRRLQYWITRDDIEPNRPVKLVSEIKALDVRDEDGNRQLFHIYNPKRFSQTRGVSAFAPIFDPVGMFEDINFAKLVQQQIVSCFAIFRQRELGYMGSDPPQQGEQTTQTRSDGSTQTIEGIAPGMQIAGNPGEKLEGFSPNVPNAEFFQHVKLILTLIGINLGMPLVLVLMDAGETNFSGWRGAVDQARMGFRRNQRSLIRRLHRPCYYWKLRQWIEEDTQLRGAAERLGKDFFKHAWNPPTWPYIEPLKDASADLLRVRNALISPRRLHAENGIEWEGLADEIVEDNAYAIIRAKTKAAEINKQFTEDPVHWRELLSLPTPDGVTVALKADDPQASSKQGAANAA